MRRWTSPAGPNEAELQIHAYRLQYGIESYAIVRPSNVYGPGDNFDPETSHVIPALIRKCVEARRSGEAFVEAWGTGNASREFLYVEDCADGVLRATASYDESEPVNIGTGSDLTIRELAEKIAGVVGFRGTFIYDTSKPDGTPQKLLDVKKLKALGWNEAVTLDQGLIETYADFVRTLA